ncbi:MAG: hypothetical protein H0T42_30760 [Deltaproteobacteria bacterium]|nr:hypothetical protein [Deltaproteobacteria bacterium]
MSRNLLVTSTLAVLLAPAVSAADTVFDPLSMDRHTPTTTVAVDFGYEKWDEPPGYDHLTVFGLTIGGHYMTPGGFGGYLAVPLSYIDYEFNVGPVVFEDSELAIGNIEAGFQYAKWFPGNTALVFHAGLALPTADDDDAGAFQYYASVPRYGDLVQRLPDSTWLRLGLSPMGRSGKLFWRADLGIDLAIDDEDNNVGDIAPIFRINVGGGVDLGGAQLLAELVTNVIDSDSDDDSASTLTLGARFLSGNLRPGVGLLLPVGFENNEEYLDFALILSLTAHIDQR